MKKVNFFSESFHKKFTALCCLALISLFSCQKDSLFETADFSIEKSAPPPPPPGLSEEDFTAISEGIFGYITDLRNNNSSGSIFDKLQSYHDLRAMYPGIEIPLLDDMEYQAYTLEVSQENLENFFSTLIYYKDVITAPGFSEDFMAILSTKTAQNIKPGQSVKPDDQSKWFFATLAAALGAGPCVTGPLAVLDTCAYIATGVLTAPTGIGAVINWGGAVASYGYALSTIGDCV